MATQSPVVRVGVAAIIRDKQGLMVVGIRKGSHGDGQWQFPGGHLEMGESYFACAERETLEETGLVVKAEKLLTLTNDIFSSEKHYITIFVLCQRLDDTQEPEVLEPKKCARWEWKSWDDVRAVLAEEDGQSGKIFMPIVNLLKEHPDIEVLTRPT
ncbi:NUDIX hydrolase domain-like protein [Chaetomium sp. MPI-CAGE-AT-0009]|nr:NUDIX hydrolase domain-like protein [Chaetomium sp. MPI-CAGE-AT-0009]